MSSPAVDASSTPPNLREMFKLLLEAPDDTLDQLEREVQHQFTKKGKEPTTREAIDIAISKISNWCMHMVTLFITGHPRIGEVSGLSALSASEQAKHATPPEVLQRLAYLNQEYEHRYPGLRYITFVNGRSRAEIAAEIEGILGIPQGEQPPPSATIHYQGCDVWEVELRRALEDIRLIAHQRLEMLEKSSSSKV